MILADTSVWIDYLRGFPAARSLMRLIESPEIASHPWMIGELALGSQIPRRKEFLRDLELLHQLRAYPVEELREFVEREKLFGQGVSLIDVQLLYACLLEDCLLWTHDRALHRIASRFGKAYGT